MAKSYEAQIKLLKVRKGYEGYAYKLHVLKSHFGSIKPDIKITLLGPDNSGKSTLLGVLISGKLDDGDGCQRNKVLRYKHDIKMGNSSSISLQLIGFDSKGQVANRSIFVTGWENVIEKSQKTITFIDVPGLNKY